MANVTINQLPVANTIDGVNDYLPIYTASGTATQGINRNTLLGLSSAPVGLTDSQTLTNKVLTSPTINGATLSGTLSGTYTLAGTPTFPASVVTLTGTQALTNKTLTSPTITAPTITNATITADTLSGFTTSNNGTVYGVAVTGGTIGSAALASNSIVTAAITDNNVTASKLATNAITLGYAQITSNFTTASTTFVQVTGLTSSVTIPAGSRRIKITAYTSLLTSTGGAALITMSIWDGVVGSGTELAEAQVANAAASQGSSITCIASVTPSAGSKTYNVGLKVGGNTGQITASTTTPALILVEAI